MGRGGRRFSRPTSIAAISGEARWSISAGRGRRCRGGRPSSPRRPGGRVRSARRLSASPNRNRSKPPDDCTSASARGFGSSGGGPGGRGGGPRMRIVSPPAGSVCPAGAGRRCGRRGAAAVDDAPEAASRVPSPFSTSVPTGTSRRPPADRRGGRATGGSPRPARDGVRLPGAAAGPRGLGRAAVEQDRGAVGCWTSVASPWPTSRKRTVRWSGGPGGPSAEPAPTTASATRAPARASRRPRGRWRQRAAAARACGESGPRAHGVARAPRAPALRVGGADGGRRAERQRRIWPRADRRRLGQAGDVAQPRAMRARRSPGLAGSPAPRRLPHEPP